MTESPQQLEKENVKGARGIARFGRLLLLVSVPSILAAVGIWLWLGSGQYAETDNAYVQQDKLSVASEINGRIVAVHVRDGDIVKEGQLLFELDPQPFRIAIAQADAQIAAAQVQVKNLQVEYDVSSVDISAAQEDIAFAQASYDRQAALWKRGFTTKADYEAAQHAVAQAQEKLKSAQADRERAKVRTQSAPSLPGENPEVAAAKAQRDQALLNLSRTKIYAPMSGRIAQADRLLLGQMMVSGIPALSIVGEQKSWIEANFKETDLDRIYPGLPAKIAIDAYGGMELNGHVQSIGAGTGSEFSILPAQNATGNWVKVTQRVPIRISIDEKSGRRLIAGLSATVKIKLAEGDR